MDLGLATLERAHLDLTANIVETKRNDGPRIRQYAARFGLTPPINWCAVALSTWMLEACEEYELEPPIKGSAVAQAVMAQLIKIKKWRTKKLIKSNDLIPGNILVWSRPPEPWMGHIGIISQQVNLSTVKSIEGNSGPKGDRVYNMTRYLSNPRLLGIGLLTDIKIETDTLDDYKLWLMEEGISASCEPICPDQPIEEEICI